MPSPLTGKESKRKFFASIHRSSIQRSDQDLEFIATHLTENFHFFRQIPKKALLGISQVIVPRHIHVNEPVYIEDSFVDSVSFIYSGKVAVYSKHHGNDEKQSLAHANKMERMYGKESYHLGPGDVCGVDGLLNRISRIPKNNISRHEQVTSDLLPSTGEHSETYVAYRDIVTTLTIVTSDFLAFLYPYQKKICWQPHRCIDILNLAPSLRKRNDLNVLLSFVKQVGFFKQLSRPNQLSLCSVMQLKTLETNDILFKQGDPGHSFFVIVSGYVSVHVYNNADDEKEKTEGSNNAEKKETNEKDGSIGVQDLEKRKREIMRTLTPIAKKYFNMGFDEIYGHAVVELREGDSFGEKALQKSEPRNATICCRSEKLMTMVISQAQYREIIAPRSSNIVSNIHSATLALEKDPSDRTVEDIDILKRIVAPLSFFKQLPKKHVESIVAKCKRVVLNANEVLIRQGDEGNSMYVIMAGHVNVFQKDEHELALEKLENMNKQHEKKKEEAKQKRLTTLKTASFRRGTVMIETQTAPEKGRYRDDEYHGECIANLVVGDSFGELALMHGKPRNATIVAAEDETEFLEIDKEDYDRISKNTNITFNISHQIDILHKSPDNRMPGDIDELMTFVRQLSFFKQLPSSCIRALCHHMTHGKVEAGVPIMVQGDMNVDGFYIILNGSVSVHLLEGQEQPSSVALHEMGLQLAGIMDADEVKDAMAYFPHSDIHPSVYDHIDVLVGPCVAMLGVGDTFGDMSVRDENTKKHHHHDRKQKQPPKVISPVKSPSSSPNGDNDEGKTKKKKTSKKPKKRGATIIAREPCELLVIDSLTFNTWLKDRPINFEPALCRRLLEKAPHDRTDEDINTLVELVESIDFFHEIAKPLRIALCKTVRLKTFNEDEVIFHQYDEGHSMFVILDGEVDIHILPNDDSDEANVNENDVMKERFSKIKSDTKKGKSLVDIYGSVVGTLSVGDSVGEQSVINGDKRSASVLVSSTTCDCIEIVKANFDEILASHASEIDFHAHSTHRAIKNATAKGVSLRGDRRLFDQVVKPLKVFQKMTPSARQELIKVIDAKAFKQGDYIYKKGDVANNMYLLVSGAVELTEHNPLDGKTSVLTQLEQDDEFGAVEILLNSRRAMNAKATTDTICLFLDKLTYHYEWSDRHDSGFTKFITFLKRSGILAALSDNDFACIVSAFERVEYSRGITITPDDDYATLSILCEGSCDVKVPRLSREQKLSKVHDNAGTNDCTRFTELSLRYGKSYTNKHTLSPRKQETVCAVGPGHLFYNNEQLASGHTLVANTKTVFFILDKEPLDRSLPATRNIRNLIKCQNERINSRNDYVKRNTNAFQKSFQKIQVKPNFGVIDTKMTGEANETRTNSNKRKDTRKMNVNKTSSPNSSVDNLLAASSSLEKLQSDGTMYSNDTVTVVISDQLDALSSLDDNSTKNFTNIPDKLENDINAQTKKAKKTSTMSYKIPHRPENISSNSSNRRNSNRMPWKRPVAQIINEVHPPISPLRSNLSRTGKTSDASKKHMLRRVGYDGSNYYLKDPPSQSYSTSGILNLSGMGNKSKQNMQRGIEVANSRLRETKESSIRNVSSPIRGAALLERYSILPDIMKAVTVLNEQTDRAREGAKLLHTLRQKNGVRRRLNILTDSKLMRGSQRRQYVRTFFGKDVSRFNSPRRDLAIVDHKVVYDVKVNKNRLGNSFDTRNYNNTWGGRFG